MVALVSVATLPSAADNPSIWIQTDRLVEPNQEPVKLSFCPVWVDLICGNARLSFGADIDMDGDTLVVGAPDKNRVHVYERIGPVWHEAEILEGVGGFGSAVAVEGDVIVVGAPGASVASIWIEDEGGWILESTFENQGCLGRSASIDQGRVALGDSCEGRIHVVERIEGDWTTTAVLEFEGDDILGLRLDSSGDRVISQIRGGVVVFELTDDGWMGTQVHASNPRSLGISGDTIAIGEFDLVTVYEWDGHVWVQVSEFRNEDASPFHIWDFFGESLSIRGDRLIVGSPRDDISPAAIHLPSDEEEVCFSDTGLAVCALPRPGAVYIFERATEGWIQQDKVVADYVGEGEFGASVALDSSGDGFAAGATFRTSNAFGGPANVNVENSVHVFSRLGV
jgi:hypothetical protein